MISCLSETYLSNSISDNWINIEGYKFICTDQPANIKIGEVCSYYKELLSVRLTSSLKLSKVGGMT